MTVSNSLPAHPSLEWAVAQADRLIHDNDVERLKDLLAEYPALLSWRSDEAHDSLLNMATSAFGDAGDAQREQWFTRGACAELLIDAGAVVTPSVCDGLLGSRARGLLELFQRKGLLPRTLKFLRRSVIVTAFAPRSRRTRTIARPSMKRSCAPAASHTRPSRHSCWNDRSRSIPSSAPTLTDTRTACRSSGAS
jgi:hypothetical protein